jgi:hypothetical protein
MAGVYSTEAVAKRKRVVLIHKSDVLKPQLLALAVALTLAAWQATRRN